MPVCQTRTDAARPPVDREKCPKPGKGHPRWPDLSRRPPAPFTAPLAPSRAAADASGAGAAQAHASGGGPILPPPGPPHGTGPAAGSSPAAAGRRSQRLRSRARPPCPHPTADQASGLPPPPSLPACLPGPRRRPPPHLHAQQVLGQLRLHLPGHSGRRWPAGRTGSPRSLSAAAAHAGGGAGGSGGAAPPSASGAGSREAAAGTGPCPHPGVVEGRAGARGVCVHGWCTNNVKKSSFPVQSRLFGVREIGCVRREIWLGMKWQISRGTWDFLPTPVHSVVLPAYSFIHNFLAFQRRKERIKSVSYCHLNTAWLV